MLRHSRHVVLSALLVFFMVQPGWLQGLPQSNDPSKTYQLAGTVINSVTGRPIPRALVHLAAWNRAKRPGPVSPDYVSPGTPFIRAMLTDSQGEFSFDNLPPGTAQVQVAKPGYFRPGQPAAYPLNAANSLPYKVQVGPDAGSVVLKLAPQAVITGTILGNDGEPFEGADVAVLRSQITNGKRQLLHIQGTASDEDGNFRIAGLMPGRYYLSVNSRASLHRMLGEQLENPGETYPAMVYFPGNSDPADATPIDLTAGQHQEANFSLKHVPAFKVAGVLLNSGQWRQLNYVMLVDQFEQPVLTPDRFDSTSGAFEFRAVPAGTYFLQSTARTRDGGSVSNYRPLLVQSNLTDLRLPIQAFDIPVVVHKDFVNPNTGSSRCTSSSEGGDVHVSDCSDYPAARLELHSLDFPQMQLQSNAGPLKGPFSLRGVAPGRYSVRAMPAFGGYIQSVRCDGVDLLREPLVVPDDGNVNSIEVVLRDDSASLWIKVRTDKPDQQTRVLVFADPVTFAEPHAQNISQGNEVYAGPLPPGAYKIFAFAAADDLDYSNFEELEKYAAQAASVTVGANENGRIVVDLIHLGE